MQANPSMPSAPSPAKAPSYGAPAHWQATTMRWRYISVRRFFNMAEESIKKATGQFVFEPNDANTWVKVKGMIRKLPHRIVEAGSIGRRQSRACLLCESRIGTNHDRTGYPRRQDECGDRDGRSKTGRVHHPEILSQNAGSHS